MALVCDVKSVFLNLIININRDYITINYLAHTNQI